MAGMWIKNGEVRNAYLILVGRTERDHSVDYSPLEGYHNRVSVICEGVDWIQWALE
jgi:hypothetical protein